MMNLGLKKLTFQTFNGESFWTEIVYRGKIDVPDAGYIGYEEAHLLFRHFCYRAVNREQVVELQDGFLENREMFYRKVRESDPRWQKLVAEVELKKELKRMRQYEPRERPHYMKDHSSMASLMKTYKKGHR